jgi:hypothetical protein
MSAAAILSERHPFSTRKKAIISSLTASPAADIPARRQKQKKNP